MTHAPAQPKTEFIDQLQLDETFSQEIRQRILNARQCCCGADEIARELRNLLIRELEFYADCGQQEIDDKGMFGAVYWRRRVQVARQWAAELKSQNETQQQNNG